MNHIKKFNESLDYKKTFKYRISTREGVNVTTHNPEDFPIENMRLEWAYTLFFQKAVLGALQSGMRIIADEKRDLTPEEMDRQERVIALCDTITTSNDPEHVQITCTQEEIEIIEKFAMIGWKNTIGADLDGVNFPKGIEGMKKTLTDPDGEYLKNQKKKFETFKKIIETRHT